MNSDSNSDSEQCTESKLGRVHRVHTLNPGCEHTAPRPRASRTLGAVSWLCLAVLQYALAVSRAHVAVLSPPPVTIQKFHREPNFCCVDCERCRLRCCACRSAPVPCRRSLLCSIAAPSALCRDTRPALPVTIQSFVSRHTRKPLRVGR